MTTAGNVLPSVMKYLVLFVVLLVLAEAQQNRQPCRRCVSNAYYYNGNRRMYCRGYSQYNQCNQCCRVWANQEYGNPGNWYGYIYQRNCNCCRPC
ncbi:unnamed protein product [Toxocara canis]|uniref:Uncharacterized protein n=1 Tax=Toxocara canis TaxID=6265 RepID=A0A183UCC5_TOXCA|nr:unnamed protein product [Toxocara canis]